MDFFISNAWAQEGPPPGGGLEMLFMFAVLFAVFYFLMIRPQMKRQKEHRQMVENLAVGDEAVTNGGLLGRIDEVGDNFILLEIAKDVQVRIQKHHVQAVVPKGTMKSL